jgi:hypothetical protein
MIFFFVIRKLLYIRLIQGLKPVFILDALRGAKAPLFHVTACGPNSFVPGQVRLPQALKRRSKCGPLAARLKSCPSRIYSPFGAAEEAALSKLSLQNPTSTVQAIEA